MAGERTLGQARKARALVAAVGSAIASVARRDRHRRRVHLEAGDVAPEFEAAASDGLTYRLSALLPTGPVIVAWFPKAFTSGCTSECRSIGLTTTELERYRVAVFAASCDTVEANRAFAESTGLRVPILSDTSKQVASAYGVLGRFGLPARWTFFIGTDGRLLGVDREVHAATHGEAILSTLERFGVPRRP